MEHLNYRHLHFFWHRRKVTSYNLQWQRTHGSIHVRESLLLYSSPFRLRIVIKTHHPHFCTLKGTLWVLHNISSCIYSLPTKGKEDQASFLQPAFINWKIHLVSSLFRFSHIITIHNRRVSSPTFDSIHEFLFNSASARSNPSFLRNSYHKDSPSVPLYIYHYV
jgi:hypothetical protein